MRPRRWISTVDTHTEGQATRIVMAGVPPLPGDSMAAKLEHFASHHNGLRSALLAEPRGHKDMYGCILTEPTVPGADWGVFFMHNSGYMNMCGHATIGVCTALAELGLLRTNDAAAIAVLDTPCGVVTAHVDLQDSHTSSVTFQNSPAFASFVDEVIAVPGIGDLRVDVGYGGNHFVFFSAEDAGLELTGRNVGHVVDTAMRVLAAANEHFDVHHPTYGKAAINIATAYSPSPGSGATYRNVHVFGPRQFDRSPGGTGTSARLAVLHAKGMIGLNEEITVESLTGGIFRGIITEAAWVKGRKAVTTQIRGSAFVTGHHQFWIDPDDRLGSGFLVDEGVESRPAKAPV